MNIRVIIVIILQLERMGGGEQNRGEDSSFGVRFGCEDAGCNEEITFNKRQNVSFSFLLTMGWREADGAGGGWAVCFIHQP